MNSSMPSLKPSRPSLVDLVQRLASTLALSLLFASPLCAQTNFAGLTAAERALGPDAPAYHALQEGRVDEAASLLRATLASNAGDALAHQLLCRVFYVQDKADDAIHQCELAVSSAPAAGDLASNSHLWLGRAYGMKARHAGPIAGFTLARKVAANFSRAVELDPNNVAALDDLGEYDVSAPSIVGGGNDKAHALASRMMPRFPASAHHLLARIALAENNSSAAESEFKQALAAEYSPETWIDLAQFYQTHGRADDALSAVRSAVAADRAHSPALVDAASILTEAKRAPDLAERCLRDYLSSRAKSDAAPAFKVHLQLGKLLAARGDNPDAEREFAASAALANDYTRNARSAQGH